MFRRYRTFACLTMACFGTLLTCASPAFATRGEFPNPKPLWKAFPLNPTGERVVKTNERPFVPPATEALGAFVPASDRDPGRSFPPILLVLLCATLVALLTLFRLCVRGSTPPKANDDGSERLLGFSIIGSFVVSQALYGYAIYTLVVLLL
jgi:hypothetical protein